jgi:hypothetical protein
VIFVIARLLPTAQARHRLRQQHLELLDELRPLDVVELDSPQRPLEQIPLRTRAARSGRS